MADRNAAWALDRDGLAGPAKRLGCSWYSPAPVPMFRRLLGSFKTIVRPLHPTPPTGRADAPATVPGPSGPSPVVPTAPRYEPDGTPTREFQAEVLQWARETAPDAMAAALAHAPEWVMAVVARSALSVSPHLVDRLATVPSCLLLLAERPEALTEPASVHLRQHLLNLLGRYRRSWTPEPEATARAATAALRANWPTATSEDLRETVERLLDLAKAQTLVRAGRSVSAAPSVAACAAIDLLLATPTLTEDDLLELAAAVKDYGFLNGRAARDNPLLASAPTWLPSLAVHPAASAAVWVAVAATNGLDDIYRTLCTVPAALTVPEVRAALSYRSHPDILVALLRDSSDPQCADYRERLCKWHPAEALSYLENLTAAELHALAPEDLATLYGSSKLADVDRGWERATAILARLQAPGLPAAAIVEAETLTSPTPSPTRARTPQ